MVARGPPVACWLGMAVATSIERVSIGRSRRDDEGQVPHPVPITDSELTRLGLSPTRCGVHRVRCGKVEQM